MGLFLLCVLLLFGCGPDPEVQDRKDPMGGHENPTRIDTSSALPKAREPGRYVSGRVLLHGEPMAGVRIHAAPPGEPLEACAVETLSRPDGSYLLGPLAPGEFRITAFGDAGSAPFRTLSASGGVETADTGTTDNVTTEGFDLELVPAGMILGRVTDDKTGGPLADIEVRVAPEGNSPHVLPEARRTVRTDVTGFYRFKGLPPGAYRVYVRAGRDRCPAVHGQGIRVRIEGGMPRRGSESEDSPRR